MFIPNVRKRFDLFRETDDARGKADAMRRELRA
jgi:hypothetical protein